MKFSRDKKGYEHTALVRPARKGGRGEGRILYWFRTPPHVRVGRSALDEEAIRLIEAHHPDIMFDWPHILKAQPVIVEEPRPQKPEGRESRRRKEQSRRRAQGGTASGPASIRADLRRGKPARPEPVETEPRELEESVEPAEPSEPWEPSEPSEPREPSPQLEDLKQPTMIEAAVQEDGLSEWEAPVEAGPLERSSEGEQGAGGEFLSPRPIEALVGAAGLERLRARHAAMLAAISEGIQDAAKREFLRGEAGRLDPDGWVTIDAARAALETYESDYETIRRQLPPRRRRRRRGRRSKSRQGQGAAPAEQGSRAAIAEVPDETNGSDE